MTPKHGGKKTPSKKKENCWTYNKHKKIKKTMILRDCVYWLW
jgi:hypothetical protein